MKNICVNKKARFEYEILETVEAGLALKGTEVKSLREGRGSIAGSFGRIREGEAWLYGMDIPEYEAGNIYNHDPKRARKLLMHGREIKRLLGSASQKGFTIVPLRVYFKKGWAKVELALVRGKAEYDKRDRIRKRDASREIGRVHKTRRKER